MSKVRTGYLLNRKGIYYACWTLAGKQTRKSTHTRDRREAGKKLAEFMEPFLIEDEAKMLHNIKARIEYDNDKLAALNDARNPPLTITQAWATYEKSATRPQSGPATLALYGLIWGRFTRWLEEHHAEIVTLRQVTPEIVSGYGAELTTERKVSGRTFNLHIGFLKLAFRVLAVPAKLTVNPFAEIQRKKHKPQGRRALTTDELRRVCSSAKGELRTLLALGLYLGARLGDCCMMEWGSVDLHKRVIAYTAHKTGRKLIVPMHPALWGILNECATAQRSGYLVPGLALLYASKGAYAVTTQVQAHLKDCGIITTATGQGRRAQVLAGFHSLRHSAVSLLREAGAPLSVTMAIVGHSTMEQHDNYTHAGEIAMQRAVAALPSVMDPSGKGRNLLPARTPAAALKDGIAKLEAAKAKTWAKSRAAALADFRAALEAIDGRGAA